jgi:dipeptidyl aminopeptidase/acylaminoacyl peptidase
LTVGGKNVWPMWDDSGERLFYVSTRSGSENLWALDVRDGSPVGEAVPLTTFESGRVLWPTAAVDRPLIAFERDFGVWTLDLETGRTAALDVRLVGAVEGPRPELRTMDDDFESLAVAPDDRKLAFVARGEIFAAPTGGAGPAFRVTDTPAAEDDPAWRPDSQEIAYVSWRTGTPQVFAYDFASETERRVTEGTARSSNPTYSPDGRYLAYTRDGSALHVVDLEGKLARTVCAERGTPEYGFCEGERPDVPAMRLRYWQAQPEAYRYSLTTPIPPSCQDLGEWRQVRAWSRDGSEYELCELTHRRLRHLSALIVHTASGYEMHLFSQNYPNIDLAFERRLRILPGPLQ